jgi:hypothetical protein
MGEVVGVLRMPGEDTKSGGDVKTKSIKSSSVFPAEAEYTY